MNFSITPKIAIALMRIEANKDKMVGDESENQTMGYRIALEKAKQWALSGTIISERMMPTLHALMMGDGQSKISPTPYREPEEGPNQVKTLMEWIGAQHNLLPAPIIAGVTFYQCTKIQPFAEGNLLLAKLLCSIILHVGGYKVKDSFFAGLEDVELMELTPWIEGFVESMVVEPVKDIPQQQQQLPEKKNLMRTLNQRQRKALKLFKDYETITATQIGEQFDLKPRTRAQLCKDWVDEGFLEVVDFSNKARKYKLTSNYEELIRA